MTVEQEGTVKQGVIMEVEQSVEVTEQEVRDHAVKMRVAVENGAKCVDGGYRENESVGAMAFAGGDLGTAMVLLGRGMAPQEAFDTVMQFCKAEGRKFAWHTDHHVTHPHEGNSEAVVGCGHCNAAILNAKAQEKYGLNPETVRELLSIIQTAQEVQPENMELVNLDRDHKERAIMVVTGTTHTVKPWDEEKDQQFFIYDKTRHLAMLERLASMIDPENANQTAEELKQIADKHTDATLGLLSSSKGKPIFSVNVDDLTSIQIDKVGNAPAY